jgi:hypothetical protein
MSCGSCAVSELLAISRYFKADTLKIERGTGPDKLLIVSISLSKEGMLLKLSGMLPTNLFTASDKRIREERCPVKLVSHLSDYSGLDLEI